MSFDINTEAAIKLSAKLGKLHRSALPVAVRGTLNDAAFETKKNIPQIASSKFTTRNKSFFRAFSSVQTARGFNIDSMQAVAGINPAKGSLVAEGLEKQETGGIIKTRKLIPHDKGRVSGSYAKRLRKKHRFENIKIAKAGRKRKSSSKYLLIKKGGKGTVFEIRKVRKKQKLTPVYSYQNKTTSSLTSTPFMRPATMIARNKMLVFYKKQAERQFKRLLK